MLIDRTVTDLLDAFSSADPTPGGGSAAALVAATGTALLAMVAGMPKSRTNSADERTSLDAAHRELLDLRSTLVTLVDRDASAYNTVVSAYRLPKGTDEEKTARRAAIQAAMQFATEVPLETIQTCVAALRAGAAPAAHGNPSAASDVKVGFRLLMAAAESARDNVDINLDGLADAEVRTRIEQDAAVAISEARACVAAVIGA